MMKTNLKKVICMTLAAMTVFGASGCASWKLNSLYIPTYEDNGQHLRTMGELPPNMTNREQVALYKAAGFNAVPYNEGYVSAAEVPTQGENSAYLKGLRVCEEFGLDVLIRPHNEYISYKPTTEPNYFEKYFSDVDFRDYPAVKGFYFVDEPTLGQIEDVGTRYLPWFNENYGGEGYEFVSNLYHLGHSVYPDRVGPSYDAYAEKFLTILESAQSVNKHFSIDYYTLRYDLEKEENYMYETNLQCHADAAMRSKAHGVEFAAFVQAFGATSGFSYRLPTTFAEINWGVNNVLAFGVTTLKFFLYSEYKRDNLLGMLTDGEPNERYYWVQQALKTLEKWDHVYLNYKWDHIYTNVGTGSKFAVNPAFEYVRDVQKPITDVTAIKSKYDLVLSEFTDGEGNKGCMLFNYDEPTLGRPNKVTLTFEKAEGAQYYQNGEMKTVLLEDGKFEVELASGEGVFVIPLYKK